MALDMEKIKAGFNPLRIGSYCNFIVKADSMMSALVSIPLESGHIVIYGMEVTEVVTVSIPLESGHIVIKHMKIWMTSVWRFQSP